MNALRRSFIRIRTSLPHALLAALPVLGLTGCVGPGFKAEGVRAATVADARSVFVTTDNGRVELVRDPAAKELAIDADIRCAGATQAEADGRLALAKLVAVRDAAGCVRISVEFPPREGVGMGWSADSASITVRAAELTAIDVVTSNGAIVAGGFSGEATLVTSNGRITVSDHRGAVHARSSNGAIVATRVESLTANTSNGRIEAEIAEGAGGSVDLATSNGSVTLALPASWQGVVTAETGNGRVQLDGGTVVDTGDGKRMTIGDAAKAKARIETSNGRVEVRAAKQS